MVPLSAFGVDEALRLVRLSCATDMDKLEAAMDVIETAVRLAHDAPAAAAVRKLQAKL